MIKDTGAYVGEILQAKHIYAVIYNGMLLAAGCWLVALFKLVNPLLEENKQEDSPSGHHSHFT